MLKKLRAAKAEESGFTLVELLIVIAILGILAGVVVFSVAGITDDGQTAACSTEVSAVQAAQEAAYAKATPHIYRNDAGLVSAGMLHSVPLLVNTATVAGGYEITWQSASCGTVGAVVP